jgi:hypothetical protein
MKAEEDTRRTAGLQTAEVVERMMKKLVAPPWSPPKLNLRQQNLQKTNTNSPGHNAGGTVVSRSEKDVSYIMTLQFYQQFCIHHYSFIEKIINITR